MLSLTFTLLLVAVTAVKSAKPPHIILIMSDDMGFNDVSFRGAEDIHTPNIDALGYAGRIFDRYYTLPICTPSRASLLTGQYAVRTGMQGSPIISGEPRGLPLHIPLLPQFLKRLNYSTHLIGKWHQGHHRRLYTPTYRGFDTFLGCYNGMIGYFSHEISFFDWPGDPNTEPKAGYDMHRNEEVAFDLRGRYATELFTTEAEKRIWEHNTTNPLFLELAHIAPHTGENKTKNEVADEAANDRRFGFIKDCHRRRYAGVVAALDDSVGRIIQALADRDMLADSIVVFINDNGAQNTGRIPNGGSNWPLRGQKQSLYEGAVRTAAVMWHKSMNSTSELHTDIFHITDWLPTLYEAAGGNVSDLGEIDGVSHWSRLSGLQTPSVPPRREFLVNSNQNADSAYVQDEWKYIVGPTPLRIPNDFGALLGDPGRTPGRQPYNLCAVINSETTKRLFQASENGDYDSLPERAAQMRRLATLPSTCRDNVTQDVFNCTNGCLFNLREDPCEIRNVAEQHPDVVSSMLLKLRLWAGKTVPELNAKVDYGSDPSNFGGAWVPWLDFQITSEPYNATAGSGRKGVTFLAVALSAVLVCDVLFSSFVNRMHSYA